ncbi:hypothetical protein PR202_gb03935 [Eleusine coracana subsp. coracana]|uniref:Phytocyanin domain-containing protein n=1 Tax=Eleusine coracana subsp. coracana TaxID=191504 RepID=A0AAV5E3A1_ELECO|nr:hypothetical protein PR202_gb03935 [Eleusine coracana subsp. coracana]
MDTPLLTIGVLVMLVAISGTASATSGNTTAAPSNAGNATANAHRNTTAPSPPFGTNHVGEGTGWFFDWKANASAANYSAWAANRTFYLGDYLSFKTDTGNTVVHTTNATAYKSCRAGDVAMNGSSGWKPEAAFLAVMLTAKGTNYFFSDAWDGEHCRNGMRFEVAVAHGRGLPSVPPEYYQPLSGAPAGWRHSGTVAMWVAMVFAVVVPLVLL